MTPDQLKAYHANKKKRFNPDTQTYTSHSEKQYSATVNNLKKARRKKAQIKIASDTYNRITSHYNKWELPNEYKDKKKWINDYLVEIATPEFKKGFEERYGNKRKT
jgi:hypothetical protein